MSATAAEITLADGRKLFVTSRRKGGVTLSTRVRAVSGPVIQPLAELDAAATAELRDALCPKDEVPL